METNKETKKRAPTALTVACSVCGVPAPDHIHFGGTCCYSCRAFFRRTVERMGKISIVCRTGTKDCEVSEHNKVCSSCRFAKCLRIGMKIELLQGKRRGKIPESDGGRSRTKRQKNAPSTSQETTRRDTEEDQELAVNGDFDHGAEHLEHNEHDPPSPDQLYHLGHRRPDLIQFSGSPTHNQRQDNQIHGSVYHKLQTQPTIIHSSQTTDAPSGLSLLPPPPELIQTLGEINYGTRQDRSNSLTPLRPPFRSSVIQHSSTSQNLPSSGLDNSYYHRPQYHVSPEFLPHQTENAAPTKVIQNNQEISPPRLPSSSNNASKMLRYEADMMRYHASMMSQRSKLLEIHARICEVQENMVQEHLDHQEQIIHHNQQMEVQRGYGNQMEPPQNQQNFSPSTAHEIPPRPSSVLENNTSNIIQEIETHNVKQENHKEVMIKRESVEIESDGNGNEERLSKKDLERLYENVAREDVPTLDTEIFESSLFREAELLIRGDTNLKNIMDIISKEKKKSSEEAALNMVRKDLPENLNEPPQVEDVINAVYSPLVGSQLIEFDFTTQERVWVNKMGNNIHKSARLTIRPEFFRAFINMTKGTIDYSEFRKVLISGRTARTYFHLMIMLNLPFFEDLSANTQKYLMKANSAQCMGLLSAGGFFGHEATTFMVQDEFTPMQMGFRYFCDMEKIDPKEANSVPPIKYEYFFSPKMFSNISKYEEHRNGMKFIGEYLKEHGRKVVGLLYALCFYRITEEEIKVSNFDNNDIKTIKKANDHLTAAYRRLLKHEYGLKASAGKIMSHGYYLHLLEKTTKLVPFPK